MRQINRYIGKSIAQATFVAMCLLLGLETFFSLVNEVRYVGTGDYDLANAITYLILQVPQRIYQMFPMSALLGSIMGLGVLASNSELVAMRAAGISYAKIIAGVFRVGLIMSVLVWLLGEFVAPASDRIGQNQRAFALSGGQALMTQHGTWMRDQDDFVHIRSLHVSGRLEGVTRYRFDKDLHLVRASYAAEGEREGDHWRLYDVRQTDLTPDALSVQRTQQEIWESVLDPEVLRVVGMKYLDQLSLTGLWHAIDYREANGLDVAPYRYALWEKITQPLVVLMMILLGISSIFGPLRNANFSLRMLMGILMGFGFYIFSRTLGPLSIIYGIPPYIAVFFPSVLVLGIAGGILRRVP